MRTLLSLPRAGWAVGLLTIAWLAVHVVAASTLRDSVFSGGLLGTDSYMRLVRVDELASGGGWFDSVIARSNAPFGDELHWTRPFDVLLLAIAVPLSLPLGFEDALFVAGATISPLLHLVMMVVLVWAVGPLVGRDRAPMAAIVLLVQPAVLAHTLAGQADHHSVQLLLLVLVIGLLLRVLVDPTRAYAVAAGAVLGLGIWVSPEMTILAGLVAGLLIAAWVRDPDRRLVSITGLGAGLVAVVALAIVLERRPGDWLAVEYDRVSVAHLAAGVGVLIVAGALHVTARWTIDIRTRVAAVGLIGLGVGGSLLAMFGGLVVGPGADVNPAIEPIWLDNVRELQPLWPTDLESLGNALRYLGPSLICLPVAIRLAWRTRADRALLWPAILLLFGAYLVLALLHLRFASFAAVLIAIVSAEVLGELRDSLRAVPASIWRRVAWIGATIGISMGFTVGGGVVAAASTDTAPQAALGCSRAAFEALDAVGDPLDVTFAHIDVGPELLYRTDLAIVAGPYHRNDRGILDLNTFFSASDDKVSRVVAAERDGRFVLVCLLGTTGDAYAAEPPGIGLHKRLMTDDPPPWLSLVASGEGDGFFRLYEIEPLP